MIFTEFRFIAFFLLAWAVTWSLRANTARKTWLLACSYAFYAFCDPRFVALIVGTTLVGHLSAVRIAASEDEGVRRRWLLLSVVVNLGVLCTFKYLDFFITSAGEALQWLGLPHDLHSLGIALPVGISFYTFQTLSYTIDVAMRRTVPAPSLLDAALYVAFFPQLVAGPIVRARTFLGQLTAPRRFANVDVRGCLVLFLVGFVKKAVISDTLSFSVDYAFASPDQLGAASIWLAVALYAVQIYCDFSGYSDMALATAGLLGYNLCPNFDAPYLSPNIAQFWRRWHISLSTWLRDYLFIPLSESRLLRRVPILALLLTMLLGGLWHGAAWNFVIWGGLHGLALVVHRGWVAVTPTRLRQSVPMAVAGTLLTLWWVGLTWIVFRAPDTSRALMIARSYVSWQAPGNLQLGDRMGWVVLALALAHWAGARGWFSQWWRRLPPAAFALTYGATGGLVLACMAPQAEPFIYFRF